MGSIFRLILCTLILVTFVMEAVPPNMSSTYFIIQYVKPGSSVEEKCMADGDPKPTYIWKKDGVVLSTDAQYEINSNTGDIKIKNVTDVSGEGTYQCFAQNSQGTALSGIWEVKVAYLRDFMYARTTPSQPVDEYSYFSMPCKYQPSSVPASKLDWLVGPGDNTTFPMTIEDKRRIVADADGTLHFLFVRASDNANNPYRCQLFNNVVNKTAISLEKINLNVSRGPEVNSEPILKYSKSVEGTIGSKATLLCIFAGNPIPNVEWLKDGVRLPDGSYLSYGTPRYKIDPEDSTGRKLIISKLEIKDVGDYICRATNTYGTNEGTVKVTVTAPAPVIVAELNLWYIALIIGILVLFIIVALIVCYLHRNRGGNYPVDKKEHQAGHDPEQELKDNGFHDVGRVDESCFLQESVDCDSDDMTEEYGGDFDVSKFNEDGSFIELYGEKSREVRDAPFPGRNPIRNVNQMHEMQKVQTKEDNHDTCIVCTKCTSSIPCSMCNTWTEPMWQWRKNNVDCVKQSALEQMRRWVQVTTA